MIVLSGLRIRFVLDACANGRNRKSLKSTTLTTMNLSGLSSRAVDIRSNLQASSNHLWALPTQI
jgi:hypothetical protein